VASLCPYCLYALTRLFTLQVKSSLFFVARFVENHRTPFLACTSLCIVFFNQFACVDRCQIILEMSVAAGDSRNKIKVSSSIKPELISSFLSRFV
jgi:hypothetical protein